MKGKIFDIESFRAHLGNLDRALDVLEEVQKDSEKWYAEKERINVVDLHPLELKEKLKGVLMASLRVSTLLDSIKDDLETQFTEGIRKI